MTRNTWPAAFAGTSVFIIILATVLSAIAWTVVLPTVGLLYFLGALA